jgi:UDP-N-acetylmuramoylalanine--D-glutamate ligase
MTSLSGAERIAVWGAGREGRAALEHLRSIAPRAALTLVNDTPLPEGFTPDPGTRVLCGEAAMRALGGGAFDVVVKSPGVSLYRDEIAAAIRAGTRFTSPTNLWFEQNPGARTIAVTGTKGKSTTSQILRHLLQQQRLDVALLGNGGTPALGHAPGRDWTILELSSYQIADLRHAPDIALVNNLYVEHVPWHGSAETYFRDKLRLVDLDPRTVAVGNFADERLRQRLAARPAIRWFNADAGFRVAGGRLLFDDAEVACRNNPLRGAHNLSNVAAACTLAEAAGCLAFRTTVDLAGFRPLPHRLEEFRVGPLLCVNDSIATVPEATVAALKAYPDREIVLLLGGQDRGQDFSALLAFLPQTQVRTLVVMGAVRRRVLAQIAGGAHPFVAIEADGLERGVQAALKAVAPDGLVLLSPAAPSFGEFRDFEERGERFKLLCREYRDLLRAA